MKFDAILTPARLWAMLCILAVAIACCYLPGLSGDFLFDDFANLPSLGRSGPVTDAASFWRYITSGTADPTGRPLALLSFLVDAQDWPADPYPFKRTNLLLHILNCGLLALLLQRLLALRPDISPLKRDLIAVASAGFWGLHPLMVSTTLYIIQREAMLPASFVLLGLLAWLAGRERWIQGRTRNALIWMLAGSLGGTLLAVLCKANGILLPMLIGALECTVLKVWRPVPASTAARHRQVCLILLGLPTLLVLIYLICTGIVMASSDLSALRPWSLEERLMTQPRILLDYLSQLAVPRPFSSGLFNDSYVVSRTLSTPWSTIPAMLAVLTGLLASAIYRHRHPVLAAAILFYFAGQLLESTTIPLELYFEHRNYLPAMLLGWPLMMGLYQLAQLRSKTAPLLIGSLLACGLLAGLGAMTHARASLWGNTTEQALVWAALNPLSQRAQAYAAQAEISHGRADLAIRRVEHALESDPASLQLQLTRVNAYCSSGAVPANVMAQTENAFRQTRDPGALLTSWLSPAIETATQARCDGLDLPWLLRFLDASQANPQLTSSRGRTQDVLHLRGLIALQLGQTAESAKWFSAALRENPRPTLALQQAALLGSANAPVLALGQLAEWETTAEPEFHLSDGMPAVHAWLLDRQSYWPTEIARLRQVLQEDIRTESSASTPPAGAAPQ